MHFFLQNVAMFIESIPNRNSPPCIFLRETYRYAGKVKRRTIANLSKWPSGVVEGLRRLFKSECHPDTVTSPRLVGPHPRAQALV